MNSPMQPDRPRRLAAEARVAGLEELVRKFRKLFKVEANRRKELEARITALADDLKAQGAAAELPQDFARLRASMRVRNLLCPPSADTEEQG